MQRFGTLMAWESGDDGLTLVVKVEYPTPADERALPALLGKSVLVAFAGTDYRACPGCGAGFLPRREDQQHCSKKCRQRTFRRAETAASRSVTPHKVEASRSVAPEPAPLQVRGGDDGGNGGGDIRGY